MSKSFQIVIDVICPWCFLGKRKLDEVLAHIDDVNSSYSIEWLPYEIDTNISYEGVLRESYRARRFGSLEKSRAMDSRARDAGKRVGIDFKYELIEKTPNTFNAHRLIFFARQFGLQSQVVDAIFKAYFQEGKDIGNLSELAKIGESTGMKLSTTTDFLNSAAGTLELKSILQNTKEVRSVPAFMANGHVLENGIESISKIIKGENE